MSFILVGLMAGGSVHAGPGSIGPGGGGGPITTGYLVPETASSLASPTTNITFGPESSQPTANGGQQIVLSPSVDLWYAYNRWLAVGSDDTSPANLPSSDSSTSGYADGLSNPTVTIGYNVYIYDHKAQTLIPQNGNVTQGQTIDLKFAPYVDQNISWFGNGFSMDSPYGHWSANAAAPARDPSTHKLSCDINDFVVNFSVGPSGFSNTYGVYIPLEVNQPTRSITPGIGLSCGVAQPQSDNSVIYPCTVTGTGAISPTFNFSATTGKFYYRYNDVRSGTNGSYKFLPGCYGNNIPMTSIYGVPIANTSPRNTQTSVSSANDYILVVRANPISYPLTAGAATDQPPTSPVIGGPTGNPTPVYTGTTYNYTFTSNDPDGDTLAYYIDSDNDGTPDVVLPTTTTFVPSGTQQIQGLKWATPGTYTIKAYAQDSKGMPSALPWSSYQITVTNPPPDLTAANVTAPTPTAGTPVLLSAVISNSNVANTGAAFTDLFQSATDSSGSNAADLGTFANPQLTPGGNTTATLTTTFLSAGPIYVRACADKSSAASTGVIGESNEANNCSASWTLLNVSPAAPPTVSCVANVSTANPGATVTWTATPSNGYVGAPKYTWADANGTPSSQTNTSPTYQDIYAKSGIQQPTVTASDSSGHTSPATPCTSMTIAGSCGLPPTASLVANPDIVRPGGSSKLTYLAGGIPKNAGNCGITANGATIATGLNADGLCNVSGNRSVNPSVKSTYVFTCPANASAQAVINILQSFSEF